MVLYDSLTHSKNKMFCAPKLPKKITQRVVDKIATVENLVQERKELEDLLEQNKRKMEKLRKGNIAFEGRVATSSHHSIQIKKLERSCKAIERQCLFITEQISKIHHSSTSSEILQILAQVCPTQDVDNKICTEMEKLL